VVFLVRMRHGRAEHEGWVTPSDRCRERIAVAEVSLANLIGLSDGWHPRLPDKGWGWALCMNFRDSASVVVPVDEEDETGLEKTCTDEARYF